MSSPKHSLAKLRCVRKVERERLARLPACLSSFTAPSKPCRSIVVNLRLARTHRIITSALTPFVSHYVRKGSSCEGVSSPPSSPHLKILPPRAAKTASKGRQAPTRYSNANGPLKPQIIGRQIKQNLNLFSPNKSSNTWAPRAGMAIGRPSSGVSAPPPMPLPLPPPPVLG